MDIEMQGMNHSFNILVQECFLQLKGIIHPKMSVITHPHVVPHPQALER